MQVYHHAIPAAMQAASEQLPDLAWSHVSPPAVVSAGQLQKLQWKLVEVAADRVVQSRRWCQKLLKVMAQQRDQLMEGQAEAWWEKLPGGPLVVGKVAAWGVSQGTVQAVTLMAGAVAAMAVWTQQLQ